MRADYDEFLTRAISKAEGGAPDEGLRMIDGRAAPPGMDERRREVVAGLKRRLAEIDGEPPRVELAGEVELTYKKNKPVQIVCRITDDYRVVDAVAMLRSEGTEEYGAVALSAGEDGMYSLEVTPEVHQNKVVEIYFEASDPSGQIGRLGSASEPLELKRGRGLFKRILKK